MKNCICNRCNSMCVCVCFIFHKFHYEFSSYSSGGSRRRRGEQEKQQPAELVGNAYDNNAEINHTWGTKMSALSVVSTMRFVQTLNIRFGHASGWGGSTSGSSVGKSSLLLRLSRQSQCLLSTGKGGGGWWRRWRCLKCLSSGPRQLRGAKPLEIVRVLRA